MTQSQASSEQVCRFPGCARPAALAADTGRPPGYCDNPEHNRAAAWRERQRLKTGPAADEAAAEARPVDAARRRASEIAAQLTQMTELFLEQLPRAIEEIRTAGDPDAAEAQIEAIQSEADERTAAAHARAVKAEQAQRRAEAERAEADAAAVDAADEAARLQSALDQAREELAASEQARSAAAAEHAAALAAWDTERRELNTELAAARSELATTTARADETTRELAAVSTQLEAATDARTDAENRAHSAERRAHAESERASRVEAVLAEARQHVESLQGEISQSNAKLATTLAERDAARADVEREQAHADQRVADLRGVYGEQVQKLEAELSRLREDFAPQSQPPSTAARSRPKPRQ